MNRNELVVLTVEKQKAAFRTFSPKKRKQLWVDKFKQIKSLNFSEEEINHLKTFEKLLNKYDFSKELSEEQLLFLNSWFEEGKLNFKWTPYFLVSGFGMLNVDAVKDKSEFQFSSRVIDVETDPDDGLGGGGTDNCDCRWDITCQLAQLGDCSDNSCEDTTFGCGWLGMQSCTGDCTG
ncbi:bacteriocin fulvocin C-related protein [uncultured Lutibacter sp.]|uniref:bacteriocin fulvocin C-related protein n=1 Tax=uncultured Lutibacter sp. TaxID=437739 RepID=UPI0026054564|nr:bacteriocin fulvocin C-related protein [uncultured Lutibacter sp.]